MERIIFGDLDDLRSRYDVLDEYDFGEAGGAVKAEVDAEPSEESYDPELAIEIHLEPDYISANAADYATVDDFRRINESPAGNGDGSGITWVVMDSGIDQSHPRFDDTSIVSRVNTVGADGLDLVGHGTACAGQIVQVAPNVKLIDLRIFGKGGSTSLDVILKAYEWLINNTGKYDGVNMSWGSSKKVSKLDELQNTLVGNGVVAVVAAGNSGGKGGSPATAEKSFSVGSLDKNGNISEYSSYNPNYTNPDVMVLGENVLLARASGTSMGRPIDQHRTVASGTSFSAPWQSAMCANYLSVKGTDVSPDAVRKAFVETADDIKNTPEDGFGITQYLSALDRSGGDTPVTATATVWQFVGHDSIFIPADWLKDGKYEVEKSAIVDAFGDPL